MASAIVRSGLRKALGVARMNPASKRSFSSGASAEEEAREAAKWEKITYVGIAACTILAFVNLSKGHPHFDEPPPYPYLHIRNKEFPWGMFYATSMCFSGFFFLSNSSSFMVLRGCLGLLISLLQFGNANKQVFGIEI